MAFLNLHNGARASDPSVLNSFPVQEAGYCAGGELAVPIHKSRGGCSLKSWTYALVVRPLSVLYSVPGTQALEVVPVTGTGGGWRASSRGGAKAGKRPRNRMWNDVFAGSERCPWTRPSVMGIGAPSGSRKWPDGLHARAFAYWGSLDKSDMYLCHVE